MTLRLLPRMFGAPIVKIVSSCSLLLLAAMVWAGPYGDLNQRLQKASTDDQALDVLASVEPLIRKDPDLYRALETAVQWQIEGRSIRSQTKQLREMVELRARAEGNTGDAEASKLASDIKKSPVYRDRGVQQRTNWMGNAADRLNNIQSPFSCARAPNINAPTVGLGGQWLVVSFWILILSALVFFLVLAARQVSWKRRLKRKATALLEEDEPERTVDEWLEMANELTSQEKYREAVRCLYLACLLKFDEAGVARFDRGQTNWEHLARIQASSKRPQDLDFKPATQAFDRIWYGKRVRGRDDVDLFFAWYHDVTTSLLEKAA